MTNPLGPHGPYQPAIDAVMAAKRECWCEYVDIGVGNQKVAEHPECPRCTPDGEAAWYLEQMLPHIVGAVTRETSQYFARRMREAQRAEKDGGNDARWAAYVFAETVANTHARAAMAGDDVEEQQGIDVCDLSQEGPLDILGAADGRVLLDLTDFSGLCDLSQEQAYKAAAQLRIAATLAGKDVS